LTPVYFIGLLNFEVNRFKDSPEYLHHGKIMDIKTKKVMYDKLNMIYLEIPKLKKTKEELNTHLEWWLYVFQNLNRLQDIPKKLRGDVIEKAFEKAEFLNLPKVEQDKYHKNLKVYRDLFNSFETAHNTGDKKGFKRGRNEGIIEGIEQGIELGIEQGIELGIEQGELKRDLEIAKKLLLAKVSIELIVNTTGLSIEAIQKLREELLR
jgi:predicted transposase/invertase (TIGR01784 family)